MSVVAWLGLGYFGILVGIVVVDFYLGRTAEYLNAYEIVRRSFAAPWPEVSQHFLWREAELGSHALVVGWVAFLIEALLVEASLVALVRAIVSLSGA